MNTDSCDAQPSCVTLVCRIGQDLFSPVVLSLGRLCSQRKSLTKVVRTVKRKNEQSGYHISFPKFVILSQQDTVSSQHAYTSFSSLLSSELDGALILDTGSFLQNHWRSYHEWQSMMVLSMSEKKKENNNRLSIDRGKLLKIIDLISCFLSSLKNNGSSQMDAMRPCYVTKSAH